MESRFVVIFLIAVLFYNPKTHCMIIMKAEQKDSCKGLFKNLESQFFILNIFFQLLFLL
jgi:hypothetical protein